MAFRPARLCLRVGLEPLQPDGHFACVGGVGAAVTAGAGLSAWMDTAVVSGLRQLWRRRLPRLRKQSESTRAETTKAPEAAEPEHTSK